jgi:hypothetical protein
MATSAIRWWPIALRRRRGGRLQRQALHAFRLAFAHPVTASR